MPENRTRTAWRVWRVMVALVSGALPATACSDPLEIPEQAAQARAHLQTVLDVMQANSVNRLEIDWDEFRSEVLAEAPDPKDIGDTFPAIYLALGLLGDNHSSYIARSGSTTITNSSITCAAEAPLLLDIPADIGYVRVTSFSGSATLAATYARNLHLSIQRVDAPGLKGWIVDVRGNGGGNMWPMIAGLGPILGERTLGYFVNPVGAESQWGYLGGASMVSGSIAVAVATPYTLLSADPRVAVLTDGRVASSGEATVIAFRGRPNTRFFGAPTCGLSTANAPFAVDGATLNLTVAKIADRNKFLYGGALAPDETISDQGQLATRAIEWIRNP